MSGFAKHIVYFIGIGGIGMSALARWFKAKGHRVMGYDKTSTPLTDQLSMEGIEVHFDDDLQAIPASSEPANTLVIYTPAVPDTHSELSYFKSHGFEIAKRSVVLGRISRNYFTVAVAGTHGKTTTSSMIAYLLNHAGVDTTAFLGGIATNFNSNLLIGKSAESVAVVEADEYDRSFLQLSPDIEVITSTDPDHLDIYGDEGEMRTSFRAFVDRLKENGQLIVSNKVDNSLISDKAIVYGVNAGTVRAENVRISDHYIFDYVDGDLIIKDLRLNLPGYHNTENAVAAIKVALILGVKEENIKTGLAGYLGVKRRFEYIINSDVVFLDDYAHHPEEIRAFLESVRAIYPDKKIKVVFQPHLFSRTKDFAAEFATSLDLADEVILMEIYPAREQPLPGVTSDLILQQMSCSSKRILNPAEILADLGQNKPQVLATLGAGDIDQLVPQIKIVLQETYSDE
jgi:UDP-N-acetylmuramate--alanine ligase